MEEARTPKIVCDWRIFLTLDLDQILGAGQSVGVYLTTRTGSRGAGHFGEALPWKGSYVDLDPEKKDRFGLPAARITARNHPAAD